MLSCISLREVTKPSKNGSRNNKEITNGDNPGDRKPRKEIRSHKCKHYQQNATDGREKIRCRRFHRKHGHNNQRNAKCKKILTQNIQEIQDTIRKPNLWIIGIDENEDNQLKGPVNIFNKIIEENFPNLKKEMPINIEAYISPNTLEQKKKFPPSHNSQYTKCTKQRKNIKSNKGERSIII